MACEKRRLIQRLLKKLTAEEFPDPNASHISTAAKYTGLHPKVLEKLQVCEKLEAPIEPIDRFVVYKKLVHFFTVAHEAPCTYDLFLALYGEIPPYVDIGTFRKILVKMDFVWKKVSPTSAVIIEKPLVRFERYNYLKRIQIYRQSGDEIYYVDSNAYDIAGNLMDYKSSNTFLNNTLKKGWMQRVTYAIGPHGVKSLEEIEEFEPTAIEDWVRDSLIPQLYKPSVVVLNTTVPYSRKLLETPTLDSLKSDIISWLDRHSITYDPKMSKYELFAIAERYTNINTDLFKIDQMLKVNGHTVLRIPKCIECVTPTALLFRVINELFPKLVSDTELPTDRAQLLVTLESLFQDLMASATAKYIEEYNTLISEHEKELLAMEDALDKVYDTVLDEAKTRKQQHEDSDIPSSSDSE